MLLLALGTILLSYPCAWLFFEQGSRKHDLLGSGYAGLWQGGGTGLAGAVGNFQQALEGNSASPDRWCDLADTLLEAGQLEKARYCFSRALDLAPASPPILLRVANFHFRMEENRQAFPYTSKILGEIRDYDEIVFSSYSRMGAGIGEILDYGIPKDERAAQSYFRYVLKHGREGEADQVWRWMATHAFMEGKSANAYLDFLVAHHRYEIAAQSWIQFLGSRTNGYLKSNYLWNGDFESEPSGSIFDWRIEESNQVETARDPETSHNGRYSLRLRFNAEENLNYSHVSQKAVVTPGEYRFQSYIRAEAITSDQGVGFRVFDPDNQHILDVRTVPVTGTSDWTRVEKTFTVSAHTKMVDVRVVRSPSMKFDSKITGTVWLDDVSLAPVR